MLSINNKSILIIFLVVICGCTQTNQAPENIENNNNSSNFKLKVINLEQLNSKGERQFTFTTDRARINEGSISIEVENPILTIYQKREPYLKVSSLSALFINDGELIILSDKVKIKTIQDNSITIYTEKFELNRKESKAYILGGLSAYIYDSIFKSDSAIYDLQKEKIFFDNIHKYNYIDNKAKTQINVSSPNAIWSTLENKLTFKTPNNKVRTYIRIYQ